MAAMASGHAPAAQGSTSSTFMDGRLAPSWHVRGRGRWESTVLRRGWPGARWPAQQAMLRTALALQQAGPAALQPAALAPQPQHRWVGRWASAPGPQLQGTTGVTARCGSGRGPGPVAEDSVAGTAGSFNGVASLHNGSSGAHHAAHGAAGPLDGSAVANISSAGGNGNGSGHGSNVGGSLQQGAAANLEPPAPLPPPPQPHTSTAAAAAVPGFAEAAAGGAAETAAPQHGLLSALAEAVAKVRPLIETVALLALWYASNIFYNIYNKQVLSVFPHATTCTVIHLMVAITMLSSLWLFRLKKVPRITRRTVGMVFPLGVLHLGGFMSTNMSLGAVNVSLTHTIKSLEPFFTVVLSLFFFGTLPPASVLLTLVPIVAGVIVASATDLSFNWYGFLTAMGSNLAFQSRNVLSKKYMVESSLESLEGSTNPSEVLDEVDLFLCISVVALPMAITAMAFIDGPALSARYANAVLTAGGDVAAHVGAVMPSEVLVKNLLAGACRTSDVFASYGLLSRLSPVTHSVANCVKRVVVIAVSILFFKTQSSYLNILGTVMALSGVFAYSMAERMAKKSAKLTLPGQAPRAPASQLSEWVQVTGWALLPPAVKEYLLAREEEARQAKAAEEERLWAQKEAEEKARKAKEDGSTEPDYFL